MIICGIDYSKNSPALCINTDGDIKFYSFIRGEGTKKDKEHFENLRKCEVTIVNNLRRANTKDYSELEAWKIEDASLLADKVLEYIPINTDAVGIEGFSYGSKGNAGLDIAGYAYCLRNALFRKVGKNKMSIFSPGNIKKNAGKGNAGKEDMLKFFMSNSDLKLRNTLFWKGIVSEELSRTQKPTDDLVDSWYIQACTLEKYLQSK